MGSGADSLPDQGSHGHPECFLPSTRHVAELSLPRGQQVPLVVTVHCFSTDSRSGTLLRHGVAPGAPAATKHEKLCAKSK